MSLVDVVALPPRLANLLANARPVQDRKGTFEFRNASGEGDVDAELLIYSEIGGYYGLEASAFAEQLAGITAKRLTVRLNSPGGSVWEGLALANLLRSHSAHVTVVVDGIAASIASVIMLAGDEVVMGKQAQAMIHDAIGLTVGNPADHREMADLLDKQSDNIAAAYRDRAGGRIDSWRRKMKAETWFSAEEAVAAGLADRVAEYPRKGKPAEAEPEPDMATAAKTDSRIWDLSVFRYAGRDEAPAPDTQPVAEAENAGPEMVVEIEVNGTTDPGAVRDAVTAAIAEHSARFTNTATGPPVLANAASAEPDTEAIRAALREVLAEAGIGIQATAVGPHDSSTADGTWDASTHEGRLPSPVPVATVRKMYGWYDEGQVEDGAVPKSGAKLPHHEVSEDGTPGAANLNGVRNALARLPQTKGLTDAERDTVERHLRGHLPSSGDSEDRANAVPDTGAVAAEPGEPAPLDGWAALVAPLIANNNDEFAALAKGLL